jgi:hypothetical protein
MGAKLKSKTHLLNTFAIFFFLGHIRTFGKVRREREHTVFQNIRSAMTTLPPVLYYMCILCMLRLQAAQTGPGVGRKSWGIERFSMYLHT